MICRSDIYGIYVSQLDAERERKHIITLPEYLLSFPDFVIVMSEYLLFCFAW